MDSLIYLTYVGIVILLGLLCSIIANKMKVPNILLLLITGIVLGNIQYHDKPLMDFPLLFITTTSILALAMIVFDSSSRFKFSEIDELSFKALKLTGFFLLLNLVFLTISTKLIFGIDSILLAALFAALMSGTSPDAVLVMTKDSANHVIQFLKIESIVNTPLMVLLPFLFIDLMGSFKKELILTKFIEQLGPFLQQIISGIGAGILVGLIVFKVMRYEYSPTLSPLAVVGAALFSYILAENLGGNGVLSVTTLGLFFGNIYVKHKMKLEEFSLLFSTFLEILVFILVGLLIKIPFTLGFFINSLILFIIFILVRYVSVRLTFQDSDFNNKEKIFMALLAPKGIAVAVVAATLFTYTLPESTKIIPGLSQVLDLTLIFVIYSIVLSSTILKFSHYFVRAKVIK